MLFQLHRPIITAIPLLRRGKRKEDRPMDIRIRTIQNSQSYSRQPSNKRGATVFFCIQFYLNEKRKYSKKMTTPYNIIMITVALCVSLQCCLSQSIGAFPAYQLYYNLADSGCSSSPVLIGAFPTQCVSWSSSPGRVEYDRAIASCVPSKTSPVRFSTGCQNSSCIGCDSVTTLDSTCTNTFPNQYNLRHTCDIDTVKIPSDIGYISYYDDRCITPQMTFNQSAGAFGERYVYSCNQASSTITVRITATGSVKTVKIGECTFDDATNTYVKYTSCNMKTSGVFHNSYISSCLIFTCLIIIATIYG